MNETNEPADSLSGVVNPPAVKGELKALAAVVEAIEGLDSEARIKVLRTVATFFGLGLGPDAGQSGTKAQQGATQPMSVQPGSSAQFSENRMPTPKEFLFEKRPVQDVVRIACLAYYLTHYRATPRFKTIDLSVLNTEAAQIKFANAAQSVDNAAKAGFLVPASQGLKQISAMGEQYVHALPDREAAREAVAHYRARRKTRRARTNNSGRPPAGGDDADV